MKRSIIFFISFLFLSAGLFAQDKRMQQANSYYDAEQFQEAADLYETILAGKQESATLYYNLGNAYFRMGELARAIVNYERASLLNPFDEDIRFNLELSRSRVLDKIDVTEVFFLKTWINGLAALMSSNAWAVVSVVCFLLFIFALFGYVFGRYRWMKKLAFYVACCMVVFSLSSFFLAKKQKNNYLNNSYAIIMNDSVTVKSTPEKTGTDLFLLHEGTKVKLRRVFGNKLWVEIQIESGDAGWVPANTIEKI